MVTVDYLDYDVLEVIFSFLPRKCLANIALVSSQFSLAVTPSLYSVISYTSHHSKQYPRVASPFSTILERNSLAVYVRHVDIRDVPVLKKDFHPLFLRDCSRSIYLFKNLTSFTCTVNVMPVLLSPLTAKPAKDRLKSIRTYSHLTSRQTDIFLNLPNTLQDITLDYASWNIIDRLPAWTGRLRNLSSLTLFMCSNVNETVLKQTLENTPRLLGLHVIGCPLVDHVIVLRLVAATPRLENLSFTSNDNDRPLPEPHSPLRHLRQLAIQVHSSGPDNRPLAVVSSILRHIHKSAPPLAAFVIKMPVRQLRLSIPVINELVKDFGHTIKRFSAIDCSIGTESIETICKSCINLERLELAVPVRDLEEFVASLRASTSLRILINLSNHETHGERLSVQTPTARWIIMDTSVKTIISEGRVWKASEDKERPYDVSFDRTPSIVTKNHWFMPKL